MSNPEEFSGTTDEIEMRRDDNENAAEIHPPQTIQALRDGGLYEYKIWGWVKISAKFIHHIKHLKGARLAIWQVIALSIDENGKCELSANEIAELSGYSPSETRETLGKLDEMGYLSIQRKSGHKSLYNPEFAARAGKAPTEHPSRKATPPALPLENSGDPSSPARENLTPTFKELKESIYIPDPVFMALESLSGGLNSETPRYVDMWREKHTDEWILKAVAVAMAKPAGIKYADTILIGWEANGYPKSREEKVRERKKQSVTGSEAAEILLS